MTIFSDSFTRANESPLADTDWEVISDTFTGAGLNLISNAVACPATGSNPNFNAVKKATITPGRSQKSQYTLTIKNTVDVIGAVVNLRTGSGINALAVTYDDGSGNIQVISWNSHFEFYNVVFDHVPNTTVANNDIIRIECEDKGVTDTLSIRVYQNNVLIGTEFTTTFQTANGAGQIGVWGGNGGNGIIDNYSGGDLVNSTITPIVINHRRSQGMS